MKIRTLVFTCSLCDRMPGRAKIKVALTSDHQLRISWICGKCRERIIYLISLADCWRECPPGGMEEAVAQIQNVVRHEGEEDAAFLRSFGVRFPDDSD